MYLHMEGKIKRIIFMRVIHAGNSGEMREKAEAAHQLWTRRTDGVLSKLSGSRLISFMMFANLTGNSCLRKAKDVFSHAFSDPAGEKRHSLKTGAGA